ncbi:MAG: hypothetical protein FJ087_15590, partial [Deltaproteobacteria bacterium]|nr:hypothetical protein [Deltaproteobacteria bacterium]
GAADCATGKGCLFDNDCISASCAAISAVCVTGPCFDQRKDGDETDVDCGGSCAADCGLGLGCAVAADCTSGICSAAGACVADFCQDGRKNGTETDVDCGGSCPLDCAAGRACGGDGDCQSALCASVSRVCVASACQDERKDGTETDVDCGGSCPLDCANGLACTGGGDCVSGICSTGGLCVGTYCEDGRKSGTETDVDCGGSCVADCADGRACGSEQDCQSGMCASVSKVCVASTCLDEFKDGDETDVDCGGSCAADCANGLSCATGADCVSAVCSVGSKCVASTCLDGRKDGSETDVDCGGTCALDCSNGQGCAGDGDCLSTLCATTSKVCVGSTCVDERKDGTETDVDCGGSCPLKCANGLACTSGASCLSGVCSVGLKCVASTCLDGRLSGDESDVDCGGSCTADCANGKNCKADGDCLSAQCTSGTKLCVASACQNQRKDANETDVDCGGACGATCADGTACLLDGDCASGVCSIGNLCVATTCENGRQDGDEGGVDCGGSCPNSCDPCTGVVCEPTACRLAGTCVDGTCTDGAAKADGSSCGGGKTCQAGFCSTMIDNGDGTVVDPVSKLVWNKAVYVRSWDSGLDSICAGLGLPGTGWRTPDIDEMRSLIRDCSVTVTGGACNIAVGGCTAEACRHVLCNGCEPMAGPDEGCWWDPVLQGTCGAPYAWFSRTVRDATTAWGVHGINASVLAVSRQPGQSSLLRCVTSHCKSGVKDSNETDVDCGGNCAGCADGKACLVNGDCASGGCSGNVCQACPAGKVKSDGACVDTSTSGLNVSGIEQIEKGPVSLYIAPPGSLVSNGGAETGDLTDWSHEGYEAWGIVPNTAVPEPVRGKPLFGAKGFVGPHGTSQLVQTIDLISAGYTAEQLDAGIQVRVGFFGRGYGRTGTDKVGLTYRFLDEFDGEVEPPFWSSYLGAEADVWGTSTAAGTWAMPAKNTTSIPPTTRKIMMVMWSMDGEGWAGQWGPVVDGAHVVLGAREMRMRNAGGAWGAWQAYAPVVTGWALPAGDGAKTVEVEFRDGAGVSLGTATDSVTVKQCMIRGACNDSGCAFDPKPDLTACDDGIPNNEADVCKNGDCVGCHDGNECTDDSWVPGTGCVHVTVPDWTTTCDNETGVCVGGACIPW